MILKEPYYYGIIRNTIVGFGQLFSGLSIVRKDGNKKKIQKIKVPIAYGPKEKWLRRVEENPDGKKNISVELPRMSFEIVNYRYDPTRKVGSNVNKFTDPVSGKRIGSPVPYTLSIVLYVISRTQEDSLQIIEQILPYFAPGLTVKMEFVDDPKIEFTTSFSLMDVNIQDNWDGDFDTPRFVTHQLTFDAKIYLFGPAEPLDPGIQPIIIKKAILDVGGLDSNGAIIPDILDSYTASVTPTTVNNRNDPHTVVEGWV